MRRLPSIFKSLRRLVHRPEPAPSFLRINSVGLSLHRPDESVVWAFCWTEVVLVETYKRDLIVIDMICIEFTVAAHGTPLVAHDDMAGFTELCNQLHQALPGISPDWWRAVAFPPFHTNFATLFRAAPADPPEAKAKRQPN